MSEDCRNCLNEAAGICACTDSLYFCEQIPDMVCPLYDPMLPVCEYAETEESDDWLDANVDGVSVDGVPLDGHYLDHLINDL